ncbi:uridine kinase family protein [Geodermatophilus sp. SYSU D00815]
MDRRGPVIPLAELAAGVLAAPPRLGPVRLVCVDGPAGSGKTTFAGRLAAALGGDAGVVHMDDLYAGWTLIGGAARLAAGVLRPLADGVPGAYRRFDWAAGRFAAVPTPVPVPAVLVVEGCGSCPPAVDPFTTLRVWVEAPAALRLARGLARDGTGYEEHWRRWQDAEAALFAADRTRERADLRIDGTAGTATVVAPLPGAAV